MFNTGSQKWYWIPRPALGGADGAAAANLFKASTLSAEDFLARESIQNSWDAARALRLRNPDKAIPFRMVFRFVDYTGVDKQRTLEAFGLPELASHFPDSALLEKNLASQIKSAFNILDSEEPLRVLYLEDYGTHGLYGVPPHTKSHLYKALYVFGVTGKGEGAGGSFGFGKGAFIRASRSRTIVAYSHFQPVVKGSEFQEDDPTTRRLVGWSWWNQHDIDASAFEGRAVMFAPPHTDSSLPFADSDADEIAETVGIEVRNSGELRDLGTSLALVDPVVDPHNLVESLEKWWWPALIDHDLNFELEIVLPNGDVLTPRPRLNETLKPFIHAYGLATGTDTIAAEKSEIIASKAWQKIQVPDGALEPGIMTLSCAEMNEANLRDTETGELTTPKVALIRGPRMVMKYYESPGRNLPISGVYLADDDLDSHLRATEPPAHDDWDTKPNADIPEVSTAVALSVMNKIKNALSKFAQEFTAPPQTQQKPLTHFSKLLGDLFGGNPGPWPPPPPPNMPVSIQYPDGVELTSVNRGEIRASTRVRISLMATVNEDSISCTFSATFAVFEDDSPSSERVAIRITSSDQNAEQLDANQWKILLTKSQPVEFTLVTAPYSADWTGRFEPRVQNLESISEGNSDVD